MKKLFTMLMLASALIAAVPSTPAQAQLNSVINKAKQMGSKATGVKASIEGKEKKVESIKNSGGASVLGVNVKTVGILKNTKGDYLYVCAETGSARADGKTPETAVRDLQKAIDLAKDGDVILVAEGNYLGNLDRGYIENGAFGNGTELGKFISIIGGYSTDFSECDPIAHITKIQPTAEGTAIKHCLLNFTARHPYGYKGPKFDMVISGLTFDMGELNLYAKADVTDDRTGTPNEGVLTGRFVEVGAGPSFPTVGCYANDNYELHINVEDNLTITNCTFINGSMFGIEGQIGIGHLEICNNVFVACRYAACDIQGSVNDNDIDKASVDFHHNTVIFSWCRTKEMGDMGQGFRFRNRIRTIECHNNIFACNNRCGVERTFYEANKALEQAKISNLYDNLFYANHWDLEIANGASKGIGVPANRIDEAEEIGPKYEGNKQFSDDNFVSAIDPSYLNGFLNLKVMESSTFDRNSAANQLNRLLGQNQQGTMICRPTMYCNKYPWEQAYNFYGVVEGYGAQYPVMGN